MLVIGYCVPVLRHQAAAVAGTSRLEYPRFACNACSRAAAWAATFLLLGYFVGPSVPGMVDILHPYRVAIGIAAVVLFLGALLWHCLWCRQERILVRPSAIGTVRR